jgi:glycosyltransferase involved in cell wall biosynthesis
VRVGLDITPVLPNSTGIGRHSIGLLTGLRAHGVEVQAFAIGRGDGELPPGTCHLTIPLRVVHAAWRAGVPLRAERLTGPVDLVHSVDIIAPPTKRPLVATIHDVAAIEFPELHPPRATEIIRKRIDSLGHAAAILANSQATADGLIRLGIEPSRIDIVHHAPNSLPPPQGAPLVEAPYLLAVGELTLRKDYATLFKAFKHSRITTHRLVVVGPDGYRADLVREAAVAADLGDRLVLAGRVSDVELSTLYANAAALCMTTREEGFGLPFVEAMTNGLPIVASDIPIVHEVAGGAAITAAPGDVEGFAAVMHQVLEDEVLRARLIDHGATRRNQFNWDRTITETIAAYRRVLGVSA